MNRGSYNVILVLSVAVVVVGCAGEGSRSSSRSTHAFSANNTNDANATNPLQCSEHADCDMANDERCWNQQTCGKCEPGGYCPCDEQTSCPFGMECILAPQVECGPEEPACQPPLPTEPRRGECVPPGMCGQATECPEGQTCENCKFLNGQLECGYFGVCAPFPTPECSKHADCDLANNERCWNQQTCDKCEEGESCPCDEQTSCPFGMECILFPEAQCRPWEENCELPPGPRQGECVPPGMCGQRTECPEGQTCENCKFVNGILECGYFGVCTPLP